MSDSGSEETPVAPKKAEMYKKRLSVLLEGTGLPTDQRVPVTTPASEVQNDVRELNQRPLGKLEIGRFASYGDLYDRPRCTGRVLPMDRSGDEKPPQTREDWVFTKYAEDAPIEADSNVPSGVHLCASPRPAVEEDFTHRDDLVAPDAGNEVVAFRAPERRTLKSRIRAITFSLRSGIAIGSATRNAPSGGKISWRAKVLAMRNAIRLGRTREEAAKQTRVIPAGGEASSGSTRGWRARTSSVGASAEAGAKAQPFKAFGQENKKLLEAMARQDQGNTKFPPMTALKVLLSDERSSQEMIELAYDPRKLQRELKVLLHKHAREEKKRLAMEEADSRQRRGREMQAPAVERRHTTAQIESSEIAERWKMPKAAFTTLVESQDRMAGNQMVIARLMHAVIDLSKQKEELWSFGFTKWYTCIDPDSWVINVWTIIYMLLILEIATLGMFHITFGSTDTAPSGATNLATDTDSACDQSFSAYQYFDAGVDLFFVVDIFCRLLLFGQIVESKQAMGSKSQLEVVVEPELVMRNYARSSLLIDLLTGCPISWISMALESACFNSDSTPLLMARMLRIFRVTRVIKLFRTYKVKIWMRQLKRKAGNTSIMQIMHLAAVLLFLNHVWTCLSWLIQSLDDEGFEDFTASLGLKPESSKWVQYSIMFMNTLQVIFAIDSYPGDTALEAWFGSLTLALSVFISATFLSKILEIWQVMSLCNLIRPRDLSQFLLFGLCVSLLYCAEMANEAQTQRDSRMNTVMQFTSRNGISTSLRNEVLDYFEFRFSNPATVDFEKRFLDDLPREMQARVISQMFPGALEKSALFKGSSEMFISEIIVRLARRPVPTMPQQVITAQGGFGSEMFLVQSGTVEVAHVDEEGQPTHVKTLGPGSTFGDLSMWMDSRHSATVTSLEFCQLHMLTRQDLEETLQTFPEQGHVIAAQALSHCLRSARIASALQGISASAAERLGRRMAYSLVEFEPGVALYLEGDEAETAFVIRKGKVEVELLKGRLEGLDDVRCIGFDALFSCRPYQETVRARETVVAYRITAADILDLFSMDKDMLEEREHVADRYYQRATTKLVSLRWALLSQDLCHVARNSSDPFKSNVIMSTSSLSSSQWDDEDASGSGNSEAQRGARQSLADQLVTLLRPQPTATSTEARVDALPPIHQTASQPLYVRPLWSIEENAD